MLKAPTLFIEKIFLALKKIESYENNNFSDEGRAKNKPDNGTAQAIKNQNSCNRPGAC